jgi:DNA replication and repair protein RecF
MFLKSLNLQNFKSWSLAQFEFSPKLNAFVGLNGAGKTNLLDAIHYLSLTKSYFSTTDAQNIKDGAEFFALEGTFHRKEKDERIHCALKKGQKKVLRKNKKEYEKLADHIGLYPSVVISPYDRDLITESSETRRRFMDAVLSQGDSKYLFHLMRYNKALQQRNRLLKYFAANHTFDALSLEALNEQLAVHAKPVYQQRHDFCEELQPKIEFYYQFISLGREEARLGFKSQLHQQSLLEGLAENLSKDKLNQYTGVGPHRDDLIFELNEKSVRKFGSQGQQKSFLIALKLAQYDFIKEKLGITPILLLDDIFDKLDEERVAKLVKLVHDEDFGQIFITDTHPARTKKLVQEIDAKAKIIKVKEKDAKR